MWYWLLLGVALIAVLSVGYVVTILGSLVIKSSAFPVEERKEDIFS